MPLPTSAALIGHPNPASPNHIPLLSLMLRSSNGLPSLVGAFNFATLFHCTIYIAVQHSLSTPILRQGGLSTRKTTTPKFCQTQRVHSTKKPPLFPTLPCHVTRFSRTRAFGSVREGRQLC